MSIAQKSMHRHGGGVSATTSQSARTDPFWIPADKLLELNGGMFSADVPKQPMEERRPIVRIRRGAEPSKRDGVRMHWLVQDAHPEHDVGGGLTASYDVHAGQYQSVSVLFRLHGKIVGYAQVYSIEIPESQSGDPDELTLWLKTFRCKEMDGWAEPVASSWDLDEIRARGRVVLLSRLWFEPSAAVGSKWAPPMIDLIEGRSAEGIGGPGALLVLLPFPLEYESSLRAGEKSPDALESRTRAMRRLYARTLGVSDLGDSGWMWKPLSPSLPDPMPRCPAVGPGR